MESDKIRSLSEFISAHRGDDPDRLALQKDKWPEIDVAAAVSTLVSRKKLSGKAPLWATTEGLVLPQTLSAEQCSGEAAARHKAALLERIWSSVAVQQNAVGKELRKPRIADLTGGLGVDCFEFSKVAESVLYNDMNPALAEAAEHNFVVLGAENIEVCSCIADTDSLSPDSEDETAAKTGGSAGDLSRRLMEFRPDVIFLDPARRDGCGKKVFLLEDCSPDILKLKDRLLELAPILIVKLSPMADIAMVIDRLGRECHEVQIVEAGGECKELLAVLFREGWTLLHVTDSQKNTTTDECLCTIVNLDSKDLGFSFRRSGEIRCSWMKLAGEDDIVPGALLFEPGKALMKAGCFRLLGESLDAAVLGRDTHYYVWADRSTTESNDAPNRRNMSLPEMTGNGKVFRILDVVALSGKSIREFGRRHPEAEVTARNVKMTSEELRKRLCCCPSDRYHIFALHSDRLKRNMLIFCKKMFLTCQLGKRCTSL